ncbi:MAG: ABC transporter permease [Solobacterium sp.]|jgi:peptide/nickel transport system permease protein|nr:ABC transporter permease [Solobacterium sp.]
MKKYLKNLDFRIGFLITLGFGIILLIGFIHLPFSITDMDLLNKLALPSAEHWLGTDQFGRDILSRLISGIQISFVIGALAVLVGGFLGILIGAAGGYFGGWADEVILKLIDVQMAFPGILLAMMLMAVFGSGIFNTVLAISIMSIPRFARITRSGFIKNRDLDYVRAEKLRGAGSTRIMFIHILPNIVSQLAATASLTFASAVMSEAGLSYLGLGMQPPYASLGVMLKEAQDQILIAPWYVAIPTAVIILIVFGFNMIGDGIQEVSGGRI